MRTSRTTLGLRRPVRPPGPKKPPRASLEQALRVLRLIRPWAAPRLPAEDLACFDRQQRQIKPLPGQSLRSWRRRADVAHIPAQRQPHRSERAEVRRVVR